MPSTRLQVHPLTGHCGAEISGVDLREPIAPDDLAKIRTTLAERCVVFFRDQQLDHDQHKAFARQFGELVANPVYGHVPGHPEIMPVVKEATDQYNIGDTWHSDMSYVEKPPLGSILYAHEVPEYGGDTLWTNMTAAWEALPDERKAWLDGRMALHSDRFLTGRLAERNAGRSTRLRDDREGKELSALHPVVRRHDETGRAALYVNFPFTWAFDGMSREESQPLLRDLFEHATRPEFACRFRWRNGSVAFWDNRCAMHYACNDYQGKRREMYRVTVAGSRPR